MTRRTWIVLAANLPFVLLIGYFAFSRNAFALFWGGEGYAIEYLARDQYRWMHFSVFLGRSPDVGLGVASVPFNTTLMPVFALQDILFGGAVHPLFTYLFYAIELFVAVLALGAVLRLRPLSCSLGAWVICLLMLPYIRPNEYSYPVAHIVPIFAEVVAAACLAGAIFFPLGRGTTGADTLRAICWPLLLAWLTVSDPLLVPLAVPAIATFIGAAVIGSESRRELVWKVSVVAGTLVLMFAAGIPQNVIGIYRYSAPNFFSNEFVYVTHDLTYFSIFFHRHGGYSAVGPVMATLGLAMAVFRVVRGPARQRRITAILLAGFAVLLGGGYFVYINPVYSGPKILYFEFALWPLYALWAAELVVSAGAWLRAVELRRVFRTKEYTPLGPMTGSLLCAVLVAAVVFCTPKVPFNFSGDAKTPVVKYLTQTIAVAPRTPFRGRVATFTGYAGEPPGIDWTDLDDHLASEQEFDTDHRMMGFWAYAIPTLHEDSAFISPVAYAIASRILARPGDRQMRNVLLVTKPNIPVLELLGVRYVLTDDDDLAIGTERLRLSWKSRDRRLRVLELPDPNLGQYSPTEISIARDAAEMIRRLGGDVDPRRTVMVESTPSGGLFVPAENARISDDGKYLHVQATSPGRSILVLPFEYSHCWKMRTADGTLPPQLFRANLFNAALAFDRKLDVRLSLQVGPLGQAYCRNADADDMVRLKLR